MGTTQSVCMIEEKTSPRTSVQAILEASLLKFSEILSVFNGRYATQLLCISADDSR